MLNNKKRYYAQIIKDFDSLNDLQKFIVNLVLASSHSADNIFSFATTLLLQRYSYMESITSRLDFLKDDMSVDVISYQQLQNLLNLLDTLFLELREDNEIAVLLKTDTVLQKILKPYIITKKKQITADALDATAKKITAYASLQAERAKWQGILVNLEEKDERYYHDMEIYTSKTFMDSYYGDMGGICLSSQPQQILRPGFYVQRLSDLTDKQIIGMSILYMSKEGFSSDKTRARSCWHVTAFNPLFSFLRNCTAEQALFVYLQFRLNIEKVALKTKLPVVLPGIRKYGIISNSVYFDNLILGYELSKPTVIKVRNAKGFSISYQEWNFSRALVIIDPRGYENVKNPSDIPTFYAHRELTAFY